MSTDYVPGMGTHRVQVRRDGAWVDTEVTGSLEFVTGWVVASYRFAEGVYRSRVMVSDVGA